MRFYSCQHTFILKARVPAFLFEINGNYCLTIFGRNKSICIGIENNMKIKKELREYLEEKYAKNVYNQYQGIFYIHNRY